MQATRNTSRRPYASENVGKAAFGMTAGELSDYKIRKDRENGPNAFYSRNHHGADGPDASHDFKKVLPHEA